MNESTMTIWIIGPHDPLIFRDAKPFGPTPGVRATSLPFPFPSTIAGGARSQAGLNEDGIFQYANDKEVLTDLKKLQVRGPLLVELKRDETGRKIKGWFVPAPLDALLFKHGKDDTKQELTIQQLVPIRLSGVCTDLDEQQDDETARLLLVGQMEVESSKPAKQPPVYWNWKTFQTWLYRPSQLTDRDKPHESHTLGIRELPRELRVHVSMDSETHTGKDGALFDTSGIEFTVPSSPNATYLSESRQFALALLVDHNETTQKFQLQTGLSCLGSERRIVSWSPVEVQTTTPCTCPPNLCISEELRTLICEQRACRLILLTPAYFADGFRPSWILQERYNVHPQLRALAIQRPKVISGWDMVSRQRKPSRRLAAAGTVLYISFADGDDATNIERWINHIWMQCVSDDIPNDTLNDTQSEASDQYRLDGFGLAVLGTWNGEDIPTMKLKKEEEQQG